MLIDRYNRVHDYLRISLTDNCNFRCLYCMPEEKVSFLKQQKLMQPDEIFSIAKTMVNLGVKKIRLTGGEPLVRKDFGHIVSQLSLLPVQLGITTNGFFLDEYLDELASIPQLSLNISIDTLQKEKFKQITRRDGLEKVWNNIQACIQKGIHIKLNVVLMKNVNDDEIFDFVNLTKELPIHLRFIEFMPFAQNRWEKDKVISNQQVLASLGEQYPFFKLKDGKNDTDKKFGIFGHAGTICFISTLTDSFCGTCNRLRLTADGKIKNCLFGKDEFDILKALRNDEDISVLIQEAVDKKHEMLGGQFVDYTQLDATQLENRSMIRIGG